MLNNLIFLFTQQKNHKDSNIKNTANGIKMDSSRSPFVPKTIHKKTELNDNFIGCFQFNYLTTKKQKVKMEKNKL